MITHRKDRKEENIGYRGKNAVFLFTAFDC